MIIKMDRQVPKYLREGWALSSIPLQGMNSVELAKTYAYELWRTKSSSSTHVSMLLDEISKRISDLDQRVDTYGDDSDANY